MAGAMLAGILLASTALAFGFLAELHPAFDSFNHFRVHLGALILVGSLTLLASRFWKIATVAIALSCAALWSVLSAFPLATRSAVAAEVVADQPHYRLLQLNLRFDNATPEQVLSLIGRARPDVITLDEVSAAWKPVLARIAAMYPYSIVCDAPRRVGGVAILSRRPFAAASAAPRCLNEGALAIAPIDFGGRVADMAAIHLYWPWPYGQPAQLDELRTILPSLSATALLAGDLNATTWSAAVRRIEDAGGLKHAAGIGPTWLSGSLPDVARPYLGLPIDHVFSKGAVVVLSARSLEAVGSDHLPVLAEFVLLGGTGPEEQQTVTAAIETSNPRF
jgi:endonuclease/exonuclease/phosphatase (EEP) superfamily protein YafD